MRLAVSSIAAGQQQIAISVCNTVRGIFEALSALPPMEENRRDTKTKMDTMLQSLIKVETGEGTRLRHKTVCPSSPLLCLLSLLGHILKTLCNL